MADVDLENISHHMRKMYITNFDIKSAHMVYVTHINNPHDFYVMPALYERNIKLVEYPGPQWEGHNIRRGANVIFESKTKQKHVRGEVYNIHEKNETCDLRATDYGFAETSVPFSRIYKPYQDLAIPPLAINCQVSECFPVSGGMWNSETIEFMKKYVGESLCEIVIKGQIGEKYQVELKNFSNPGIAMEMALIGLSQLCCGANSVNKLTYPKPEKHYFNFKSVKVGDQLRVRAVTGKTLEAFYVAEVEDYRLQMEERSNFFYWSKQCKTLETDKIKEGAAVLVFDSYYHSYERAIVKQLREKNKVTVHYIDSGIEKTVSMEDLKELSEKFFRNTATAIYCAAENSQKLDYRLLKFLYPGFEFIIKILELGDRFNRPHIVNLCSV